MERRHQVSIASNVEFLLTILAPVPIGQQPREAEQPQLKVKPYYIEVLAFYFCRKASGNHAVELLIGVMGEGERRQQVRNVRICLKKSRVARDIEARSCQFHVLDR